ncbi:Hypothetical protein, putative [Bodo saltans]|uniref:Uncharacterized protein n=1 Tax=Bodo saltans TaxID=75058 RepID=A0A0S4IXC3_BODSA|nr:Hypothetical protein, putative [Bodo saltans]|eukprot:CUG06387.1 Hypothetical protein, putative [Bodo saltans]
MSQSRLRAFYIGLSTPEAEPPRRAEPVRRQSGAASLSASTSSKPIALASTEAAAALNVLLKHHKQLQDDITRAATF